MTQAQIAQIVASAVTAALAGSNGSTKGKKSPVKAKPGTPAGDAAILAAFVKAGYKDAVLRDRNDLTKPFNVRPFGKAARDGNPATGWIGQGRVVRKGQHSPKGARGLFHIDQTDALVAKS